MKQFSTLIIAMIFYSSLQAQVDLSYYLPDDVTCNPSVPVPESVIGYQVGEWHVTHDKLVNYMKVIAEVSDRAILQVYGHSYENRPLLHLIFTSIENHSKLEQLKAQHQLLSDPAKSKILDIENMPVIVTLGYSVHGNEASAANSSLLTAYYLAAAEGPEIENMLANSIILVDPCLNPDGFTRHSTWVNIHKSKNLVTDPNARGFNEVWPGGRTNHYWFDLNRDWLLLTNPESRGRVKKFHEWKPNIVTDHHEMGSNSTFFFQPGISTRNNPLTPESTSTLTRKIAEYHAKALDQIGSLYYSEETYDDFYYGKGSSYPDVNAGIGILFEQASIRGHARETNNGIKTFPFAIRNQFTVTLSTLKAALEMKNELLEHQKEFYLTALEKADTDPVKAYIFGDTIDRSKLFHFVEILQQHKIRLYEILKNTRIQGKSFGTEYSYIVPLKQSQYRMIQALFQKVTNYRDSSFYDVSTWTLPLSFNIPYAEIKSEKELSELQGREVVENKLYQGQVTGSSSNYAYLFSWDQYYSPKALYRILSEGLRVKVSTSEFTCSDDKLNEHFTYGTILIPVSNQDLDKQEIYNLMKEIARECGINIYPANTGLTPEGIDLGSGSFVSLEKPEILMLTGDGISSSNAGEIWHLFDQRYNVPITMADISRFNGMNLNRYNTMILVSGSYSRISNAGIEKMKSWLQNGGIIIGYKGINQWLSQNQLAPVKYKKSPQPDTTQNYRYIDRNKTRSLQYIPGGIFEVKLDLTHPIAYGYHRNKIPVFKTGTSFAEKSKNPFATPALYTDSPLLSGYISSKNLDMLKNSAFILINTSGRGKVISILDDTNFRGVWYGTNKILANAIFFGSIIR
jgi:hypothetical protein